MSEPNQNIHEGGVIPNAEAKARKDEIGRLADERIHLRDAAEREIVQLIVGLAKQYDALDELAALDDFTIPNMRELATKKGVAIEDWNKLITAISPLQWQLMAVVGGTWDACWLDFKHRIPSIIQDVVNEVRGVK